MLSDWLHSAKPGDRVEYARGDLAKMRFDRAELEHEGLPVPGVLDATCDAAREAWRLYLDGAVLLVQRRNGAHDYSYLAVRCQ